jgi:hypothetical protein
VSSEKGSSISPFMDRFMPPDLNLSSDEWECGCNKCELKGWKTVTHKTYARHKEAREQTQFSVEFQQFLQGVGPSTQILDLIPTTSIPSTSTSAPLPISNRNEISQLPITIRDLSIDVSMMSLDDSEDEGKENEDKDEDSDENGKDSSHSEVGDISMYTGGIEVRSCAFLLAEYIKNLLVALLHF